MPKLFNATGKCHTMQRVVPQTSTAESRDVTPRAKFQSTSRRPGAPKPSPVFGVLQHSNTVVPAQKRVDFWFRTIEKNIFKNWTVRHKRNNSKVGGLLTLQNVGVMLYSF